MYELVCAEEKHLPDLIELVAATGVYKIGLRDNKLGLTFEDFMLRFVMSPSLLKHAYVLINSKSQDDIIGCVICGRPTDLDQESSDWVMHISDSFYNGIVTPLSGLKAPGDFLIHSLAIRADMQGQGFGRKLLSEAISIAEKIGSENNVSLVVWSNDVKAVSLYNSMGFIVTDIAHPRLEGFPPALLMEKNSEYLSFEKITN